MELGRSIQEVRISILVTAPRRGRCAGLDPEGYRLLAEGVNCQGALPPYRPAPSRTRSRPKAEKTDESSDSDGRRAGRRKIIDCNCFSRGQRAETFKTSMA